MALLACAALACGRGAPSVCERSPDRCVAFGRLWAEDYAGAVAALRRANAARAHPNYQFNIALAYARWGGFCEETRAAAEAFVAACKTDCETGPVVAGLAEIDAACPPPQPAAVEAPEAPPPERVSPPPSTGASAKPSRRAPRPRAQLTKIEPTGGATEGHAAALRRKAGAKIVDCFAAKASARHARLSVQIVLGPSGEAKRIATKPQSPEAAAFLACVGELPALEPFAGARFGALSLTVER